MRAAFFTILAISSFCLALPINRNSSRGLLGILGAVKQAITNPALDAARLEVVRGLGEATASFNQVSSQASATSNQGVQDLATQAQTALASAKGGVGRIGASIVSGAKPSTADQKTVAQGIIDMQTAVNGMTAAITTPDATLSNAISNAVKSVNTLQAGGLGVLKASGESLATLGLPDNSLTA